MSKRNCLSEQAKACTPWWRYISAHAGKLGTVQLVGRSWAGLVTEVGRGWSQPPINFVAKMATSRAMPIIRLQKGDANPDAEWWTFSFELCSTENAVLYFGPDENQHPWCVLLSSHRTRNSRYKSRNKDQFNPSDRKKYGKIIGVKTLQRFQLTLDLRA